MKKILLAALCMLAGLDASAAARSNHPNPVDSAAAKASNANLSNVTSSADNCGGVRYNATLTFAATVNDGGGLDTVWFVIFDDNTEKFAQSFSAPVGQLGTFAIAAEYPGGIGQAAPGIGIYVGETRGSGALITMDPFIPSSIGGCTIGGTAPQVNYSPAAGTTIAFPASGIGPSITVSNGGGGTGSGPAATSSVFNCLISTSAAFPTASFNPAINLVGSGTPAPAAIILPNCVPQSAPQNANLSCTERRGSVESGSTVQRSWTLTCPSGAPTPVPSISQPRIESAALNGGVPNGPSRKAVASRNALRVSFMSDASDLVAGDTNGRTDIFLRDRVTNAATRVSAVAESLNGGAAESFSDPAISADGTRVAFSGSSGQIYAMVNGAGQRVSVNSAGVIGNGVSGRPIVPGTGGLVFFDSLANNLLVIPDTNSTADIFAKNLSSGEVILISRGQNGEPADGPSSTPHASDDGQTIVFHTLAENIAAAPPVVTAPFAQNFDGVTAPVLPAGWTASNPVTGNSIRWATSNSGTPAAHTAPNYARIDDQSGISDKVLESPAVTVTSVPATLSFQRYVQVEVGFDGMVLEISINGGAFTDAVAAGGSFTAGGYDGQISTGFQSPIAGRNAWTQRTASYMASTYTLPASAPTGASVRFRWRMVTDASVGDAGAHIDSVTSTNLRPPTSVADKAGTIQQAMMMRGGGFGQTRIYLSRNRATGALGNGNSINIKVTPDGRFGVFESLASNLIDGDANAVSDIYRFEIINNQLGGLQRMSVSKTGVEANGASRNASISDDGQTITFETDATNLVLPDSNGSTDIMVKFVATGDVARQVLTTTTAEPNGSSNLPSISGDGTTVFFGSGASNLVPGDTNSTTDMFSARISTGAAADEPSFTAFALPPPSGFPNCPGGYFTAVVDDGPSSGITNGIFGLALTLNAPGTQLLDGGLNFGGLLDGSQAAFAGFNVQNPRAEQQRLNLSITGNAASSLSSTLPVRIRVIRQPAAGVNETIYETVTTLSLATPFNHSINITPGFHVVTLGPEGTASVPGGAADGQAYISLTTSFLDRPGGGFFAGVIVGGYHAAPPFGDNSGFAAFCLGTPHAASASLLSAPTYGITGARDLRLRLLDHARRTVLTTP